MLFLDVCVAFPLQLLGRIRWAVLPLGGSAGCASALESSSGLKGPSPQAFTTFGGGIAWRLRRPKKGNDDGAEGIFGFAGRVWASALRPDPP